MNYVKLVVLFCIVSSSQVVNSTDDEQATKKIVLPYLSKMEIQYVTPNTFSHTWKVNETVNNFTNVVSISDGISLNGSIQWNMEIEAIEQANGTFIHSFSSNGSKNINGTRYYILTQGYLSPPNVTYVMEPHPVWFSWSAPFSLNITDYEPYIWYCVRSHPNVTYVMERFSWSPHFSHNITDYKPDILYYVIDIITAYDNITTTTTDTVYELPCQFSKYRVEIAAVNFVGRGEKYTSPQFSPAVLNLSDSNVTFSKDYPVINIQISTDCQKDIHYNIELIPTFSTKRIYISNSSSVGQTSLTLSSPDIQLNEHYEAVVIIMSKSSQPYHLDLSTFDVQTVEITPQNDEKKPTDITCHFALGSQIKGCIIIISNELNLEQCEYTATREEGSTEGTISVMLPRGEYTVIVYDDEDAEVENPAYNTTITISNPEVVKSSGCRSMINSVLPTMAVDADSSAQVTFTTTFLWSVPITCVLSFDFVLPLFTLTSFMHLLPLF